MAGNQYKSVVLIVTAVLALFAASPALQRVSLTQQSVHLTELSILGSYDNATYPVNVTSGQSYQLHITVDNHLGSLAYYVIEVKFRNQTQSAPDSFAKSDSNLPSLGDFTFCLADGQSLELPVTVALNYDPDLYVANQLDMQNVKVNGFQLSTGQTTIAYDTQRGGYYGNLFFELWLFNDTTNSFQYNQRYVSLWLNMT